MQIAKNPGALIRRKPGRKPKISRELIIKKSLDMLETTSVEDFMLKNLSRELGTAPMAIYNYFGSRDELLVAIADEVCLLFTPPKPGKTWQETLIAWLWAVKKHADRYPILPSIVGVNGIASAGWVKVTEPVTMLLHKELGLKGKPLALATFLFASTALSMLRVVKTSADYMRSGVYSMPIQFVGDEKQAAVLKKTQIALSGLKEKDLFDALFTQLVKGIEVFLG